MSGILERIEQQLETIGRDGRLRRLPAIDNGKDKYLQIGEQRLLNLASNDYLGLSSSPLLAAAAHDAINEYGASSGASRLVTGNNRLYQELEHELASFKAQPAALVFNSGYTANLCLLATLADRHTLVFSDRLNHASIIDGISLSGAKHVRYRHNDMAHLATLLTKHKDHPHKLIITDSVFSMDGDLADLPSLVQLKHDFNCLLVIDEAHATGIFGHGRGLAHELGVEQEIDLHMGTFSKALGSFGGYVAGSRLLIDYLINTGRALIYTTGLPPATVASNLAAIRLLQQNPDQGQPLLTMARNLVRHLQDLGIDTGPTESHIIPIIIGDNERTLQVQQQLHDMRIHVGAIRPPTVPTGTARLRLALRADLTLGELELLTTQLSEVLCR